MADVFAPQPVKTKTAGDVVVNINTGQTVGLVAGAAVVGKFGIDQTTPGTTNAVQVVAAIPAGANIIGKTGIDQTTPGTTNGVQVVAALPAGAAVVGKFGIDQTTPGTTNAVALTAGAAIVGALVANQSINTTQLAGTAIAVGSGTTNAGVQRVILATDQATLAVSQGLSFTTVDSGLLTSVALAAGASVTLSGAISTTGTAKLFEATIASSVALKVVLQSYNGTTATVKRTFFVPANAALLYEPSRYDAITFAGAAGACFQLVITNNDNANAADVYASLTHAI